jgi:hypothetical protein
MNFDNLVLSLAPEQNINTGNSRCVVRLVTSTYPTKRGLCVKRELQILKRKSYRYNILEEDLSCLGVNEVYYRIENLDQCEDGVYEFVVCNELHDVVEDYDYRLVKYDNEL